MISSFKVVLTLIVEYMHLLQPLYVYLKRAVDDYTHSVIVTPCLFLQSHRRYMYSRGIEDGYTGRVYCMCLLFLCVSTSRVSIRDFSFIFLRTGAGQGGTRGVCSAFLFPFNSLVHTCVNALSLQLQGRDRIVPHNHISFRLLLREVLLCHRPLRSLTFFFFSL